MLCAQESGAPPAAEQIEEIHDTQKLNKVLKDYNKNLKKVEQDAETIKQMQASGEVSEAELDNAQLGDPELEKAYKQAQGVLSDAIEKTRAKKVQPVKTKYSDAVRITLGPLQKLSESELVAMLKENTRESKMAPYLEKFPNLMLFAVRMIKDPEAIPALVRTTEDQDKLIHFGGLMLSTILIGFLLKYFFHREGRSIPQALLFWFLRFLVLTGLRLGLIFYFFASEITPMLRVAHSVLFS